MERGGKISLSKIFSILIITIVVLLSATHSFVHVAVFGTGLDKVAKSGISGLAVGSINTDDLKTQFSPLSRTSQLILIVEWSLVIVIMTFYFLATRLSHKKNQGINIQKFKSNSKTDLDVLYDLLQERKSIPLSTISSTFKVSEDTVKEWAKVLESNNLASIYYPRFGEAELREVK